MADHPIPDGRRLQYPYPPYIVLPYPIGRSKNRVKIETASCETELSTLRFCCTCRSSASLSSAVAAAVQANGDIGGHGEGVRSGAGL